MENLLLLVVGPAILYIHRTIMPFSASVVFPTPVDNSLW